MQGCKRAVGLAVAAAILIAAPARAAVFTVTTEADTTPNPMAACVPGSCSLRQAIEAADASGGPDQITVPAGTYTISNAPLSVTSSEGVSISGAGAASTVVSGGGAMQVLSVSGGSATISGLTLSDGVQSDGPGGNVLVSNPGTLTLDHARVTRGRALSGGGIAASSAAALTVSSSLIDNNTAVDAGGGIWVSDDGLGTATTLQDTTIAFNTAREGGGLDVQSNGSTTLRALTIAYNPGDGVYLRAPGPSIAGSILAGNTPLNCAGVAPPADGGGNVESGSECGLAGHQNTDPQLATALTDAGEQTQVLPIAPTSPAVDIVSPCLSSTDQRDIARPQGAACDAGAFELVPAVQPPPTPTPTATPTPTPTPTPSPEPQKAVTGHVVDGRIFVRKPGSSQFVALDPTKPIPVGSVIDSKQGEIRITALLKKGGKPQTATFYDGIFKLTQSKKTTDLTLSEALAKCGKGARTAAKKPKSRKLWGNGSGSFRTRGQYSSATVRGTKWLVQDTCAGTLTRVAKGVVSVRDDVRHKTLILRAHKRYLARPR